MHALGIMVIIFGVVPYEQFHTRALQREIQMKWDKSSATLDNQINLGGSTSLSTMGASVSIPTGKEVQSPPLLDGRHNGCQPIWLGRGGVLGLRSAQSHWMSKEARLPINVLELRAVRLCLEQWTDPLCK